MSVKRELIEACHKVYEKGFVAATDGNLSVRIAPNQVWITPSGKNKGELRESDLIRITLEGEVLEGARNISTENKIHLLAYKNRKDINAVVHCHPVYATAFASSGEDQLNKPVFPEVVLSIGKIPICKYGTPSTNEVVDSINPYIDFVWALLLQNHGAVTFGTSIKDAYYKMEKLEQTAKILFTARQLGQVNELDEEQLEKLYSAADKTYNLNIDDKNKF